MINPGLRSFNQEVEMKTVTITDTPRSALAPELCLDAYKNKGFLPPEEVVEDDVIQSCIVHQGGHCGKTPRSLHKFESVTLETADFRYDGTDPGESPITVYDASGFTFKKLRDRTKVYHKFPGSDTCFAEIDKTDLFYRTVLGKNPVDSGTKEIMAMMNLREAYNNAFWNGRYIAFGEVDKRIFTAPLYTSSTIVTHELGHAVVTYAGGLDYQDQSGALNESLADVLAIVKKHKDRDVKTPQSTPEKNWYIGEGLLANDKGAGAIRRFDKPGQAHDHPMIGKDSQPDHMNDYLHTERDSGGVHTNSGIPNKAFYNASVGLGSPIWKKSGIIWAEALDKAHPQVTFSEFAIRTIRAAKSHGGENAVNIVGKAWRDVGVDLRMGVLDTTDKTGVVAGGVLVAGLIALTAHDRGFGVVGTAITALAGYSGTVLGIDRVATTTKLQALGLKEF